MKLSSKPMKKRLRFTYEDDIIMLREVVSKNPFKNGKHRWDDIRHSMFVLTKKDFTVKSIRQHIQILLEQWSKKENCNQKSSGIEEPYSEKDALLQELYDIVSENKHSLQNPNKRKLEFELGQACREKAASDFYQYNVVSQETSIGEYSKAHEDHQYFIASSNNNSNEFQSVMEVEVHNEAEGPAINEEKSGLSGNFQEQTAESCSEITTPAKITLKGKNILGPIRSRAKKTSYTRRSGLDYLKEKNEKEMVLEEKRLKLEERRMEIEERKVALAEKKFELEKEQYQNMFESQQQTITLLFEHIKKHCQCKAE